jgi:broad specificity phosphatase PhoE
LVDARLAEVDFGRWEGLTIEQVTADDAEAVERWAKGARDFAFPGGEKLSDFADRVVEVANAMAEDQCETVVAFTHGGVIRHLICHYLGLPFKRHPLLFEIHYASLSTIALFNGKGVLSGLNLVPSRRY